MEYIVTFLEGIASFISPCVLPMIPIYISYFTGQDYNKKNKALTNSVGFVIGFSIIFVLLGVLASSIGSFVLKYQNIIKIVFGAVIIIFGLNMMEKIKIPFLNRTLKINSKKKDFNFLSSILFGILFSIGWTPCVGAFLGSALMMASTEGEILKGSILLLCYSIGLGIPFIISSLLIEKLKKLFTWIKEHYNLINTISGLFLILIGIIMIGQVIFNNIETKENKLIVENQIEENVIVKDDIIEENEEGGNIMDVNSKNFKEEVLDSKLPVLVDFWASWCGPCKMMSPVVEEIANEMQGKTKVCKVNVDEEQALAMEYSIMSIPTFLIFKDGKVVNSVIGVQDKEKLVNLLQ